jgi:hypothetical protein
MELPCFRTPCFETWLTSLFWRSVCKDQVLSFVGRPPLRSRGMPFQISRAAFRDGLRWFMAALRSTSRPAILCLDARYGRKLRTAHAVESGWVQVNQGARPGGRHVLRRGFFAESAKGRWRRHTATEGSELR